MWISLLLTSWGTFLGFVLGFVIVLAVLLVMFFMFFQSLMVFIGFLVFFTNNLFLPEEVFFRDACHPTLLVEGSSWGMIDVL